MARQVKTIFQRLLLVALCSAPGGLLAAEPVAGEYDYFWTSWFSLPSSWRIPGFAPLPKDGPGKAYVSPAGIYNADIGYFQEDVLASMMRYGGETLILDFAHERNKFTAAIRIDSEKSLQTGVGITHYGTGSAFAQQKDQKYISFLLRYSF